MPSCRLADLDLAVLPLAEPPKTRGKGERVEGRSIGVGRVPHRSRLSTSHGPLACFHPAPGFRRVPSSSLVLLLLLSNTSTSQRLMSALRRPPRLVLFTGPHCSLCDVFKQHLADLKARHRLDFDLALYNIREGDKLYRRLYQYHIPVLAIDTPGGGREIMRHRWDEAKLLEALERHERDQPEASPGMDTIL